jgi:hypothetical protein
LVDTRSRPYGDFEPDLSEAKSCVEGNVYLMDPDDLTRESAQPSGAVNADRNYRLILITGFPRSGTTWIGEQVAKRFEVDYIFEPFSIRYHPRFDHSLHLRNMISNFLDEAYYSHGWYYTSGYRPQDQVLFHQHVNLLRDHYNMERKVLVIKQPLSVKLNWALNALRPDHIYWIDRHPGGIFASFVQRNMLKNWTRKEYSLFSKFENQSSTNIGRLYFSFCSRDVQRFFTLFHEARAFAMKALEDYCWYHIVSYEEACLDLDRALSPFSQHAEPKAIQSNEIDMSYKLEKGHLNTDQDSARKRHGWQTELPARVLRGMQRYFSAEDLKSYSKELPASTSVRPWWRRLHSRS